MLAAEPEALPTSIDDFLNQEEGKELLRFTTAGSVDDGKSTLIGRLLFDSKGVYEDQLTSVRKASVDRGVGPIDFSLLTDGLRAEREQGITIDVAYRYFATPRRKFIIADTPGHEQYTRNMATGASTAQLAVVLVDARKGILPQSRRHAYIASLLGIPQLAVAVNKMDLVDFSEALFREIESEFGAFAEKLGVRNLCFVPISALEGDNVVSRSARTPWYSGPHFLEHLETVPVEEASNREFFRFPVQYVIRDAPDFRGYAGQIASGVVKPGDPVMVLPSGRISRVRSIPSFDGERAEAFAPMSATLCLEDEIDVGRGDMLVSPARMPHVSRRLEATLVWMHKDPLQVDRVYHLKQTTAAVRASVKEVVHRVDVNTLAPMDATTLTLNEIGVVSIETNRPLFFDAYAANRATGCFVLIDPADNLTVGAGMIRERSQEKAAQHRALEGLEFEASRLTPAERYARAGHHPATIWLHARRELAYTLERILFDRGCLVHVLADDVESAILGDLARVLNAAGAIAICSTGSTQPEERERVKALVGETFFVDPDPLCLSPDDATAAGQLRRMLEDRGVLPTAYRFSGGEGI